MDLNYNNKESYGQNIYIKPMFYIYLMAISHATIERNTYYQRCWQPDFILSQNTNDLSNIKDSKGQYVRIEYFCQCSSQFSDHQS